MSNVSCKERGKNKGGGKCAKHKVGRMSNQCLSLSCAFKSPPGTESRVLKKTHVAMLGGVGWPGGKGASGGL